MTRRFRITVCRGPTCGGERDSHNVQSAFVCAIQSLRAQPRAELVTYSCFGRCRQGPNVLIEEILEHERARGIGLAMPPRRRGGVNALYNRVTPAHALEIVQRHVLDGCVLHHMIEAPEPERIRHDKANPGASRTAPHEKTRKG